MRSLERVVTSKTLNVAIVFGALSLSACTADGKDNQSQSYSYQTHPETPVVNAPINDQTYGPFTERVRMIDGSYYYDGGSFAKLPRYALQAVVADGCVLAAMTDPTAAGNSSIQATSSQWSNYKSFLSQTYTQSAEPTDSSYLQIIAGCPSGPLQELALVPSSYMDYAESQLPIPTQG